MFRTTRLPTTQLLPGILLTAGIAAIATLIGTALPVIGPVLPAVVIGLAIALLRRPSDRLKPGIAFSSSFLLQLAVVLLGAQLSLGSIIEVGVSALPVMVSTLAVCFLGAWFFGRMLRIPRRLSTLIGVGTGICGASAIAAVSPVIGAAAGEIAYAMATIFLFNILAVALFPLLGHALDLDPHTFGLLAGTAINDTSSVVAAAGVFGTAALGYAVVVKLVRSLAIIPVSITLSIMEGRREGRSDQRGIRYALRLVPWFLIGFVIVALVNSLVVIPDAGRDALVQLSTFLIAMALAGIGLSTDLPALRRAGWRPLLLGAILWVLVTATSVAVIALT